MKVLHFVAQGRYFAQEVGCGANRYPEGAQPPPCVLEAAGLHPHTKGRTYVAAVPAETFALFAVRVAGEAGESGPHTAHISAEDAARNVAPRRQDPVTGLQALQAAGFTVEICG